MKELDKIDWTITDRKTSPGTVIYTIPVVVHVLHTYGPELIPDNYIYNMIDQVNSYFLLTNPDTAFIVPKFKHVAANTQIAFKLATIDPNGNPTKGIDHINTYLTDVNMNYPDQSKVGQWPQERYLNIWIVNGFSIVSIGAMSYSPYSASYNPYYDGVEFAYYVYDYANAAARYIAEYLNLPMTCIYLNYPPCIDFDGIPDTPPCYDDYSNDCSKILDSTCDTPNRQNIMYHEDTPCSIMFTYGQGQYMQTVLNYNIGKRDSLVSSNNFLATGCNNPIPDLPPVADYTVNDISNKLTNFTCINIPLRFTNYSWNDTVTGVSWDFSNGATTPHSVAHSVNNIFTIPGWATVSLSATGNNSGTSTLTNDHAVYVADTSPVNGAGYVEEFAPGGDLDKWPSFNYYKNGFKWQLANTGFSDNSSMEYVGYDYRTFPQNMTGSPQGDYDDLYSPVFDLSGFGNSNCYLNFESSGASLTSVAGNRNDSLEISCSTNYSASWTSLKIIKKNELINNGTLLSPYTPGSASDWVPQSVFLNTHSRNIIFRFRYYPGADSSGMSSGNNFYLDHFNFSTMPEDVKNITPTDFGVKLFPNPASGNAWILLKDNGNIEDAEISVSDITGKEIYHSNSKIYANTAKIEIPETILINKGIYLVHVTTKAINQTQKLIAY